MSYSKAEFRILQKAWVLFDRTTAYGCTMRKKPFDTTRMELAWENYLIVLQSHNVNTEYLHLFPRSLNEPRDDWERRHWKQLGITWQRPVPIPTMAPTPTDRKNKV